VPSGPGIRDDSGVQVQSDVSIHYDPMISKLATWGRTRHEAINRMKRALDEYVVGGIKTTLPFFREIIRDQEFIAGRLDTGFISRFNVRREAARRFASTADEEIEARRRDLAIIASAIHYIEFQRQASIVSQVAREVANRWKLSGRPTPGQSAVGRRRGGSARGPTK
ncbi:MAG: hypothetical protein ACRD8U_13765, partial [Pyrinomonadaceae bacterium]